MWRSGVKLGHSIIIWLLEHPLRYNSSCLFFGPKASSVPTLISIFKFLHQPLATEHHPTALLALGTVGKSSMSLSEAGCLDSQGSHFYPPASMSGAMPGSSSRLSTFYGITQRSWPLLQNPQIYLGVCASLRHVTSLLLFCSALYGKSLAINYIFLLVMGHIFPLLYF